ncbi:hypothetical protein V501_09598 [Pseudogymnoascus sp. VKM F-4519 (FW-2642)]|nr:hypothetical protein V501_09598 [Pseudogymnoascus sp. VKM F-4519 (FW-2642)]
MHCAQLLTIGRINSYTLCRYQAALSNETRHHRRQGWLSLHEKDACEDAAHRSTLAASIKNDIKIQVIEAEDSLDPTVSHLPPTPLYLYPHPPLVTMSPPQPPRIGAEPAAGSLAARRRAADFQETQPFSWASTGGVVFAMSPYNPGMGMMEPGFPNEIMAQGSGMVGGVTTYGTPYNNTGAQISTLSLILDEIFSLDEIMTPHGDGLGAGVPTFGTPYNNTGTQMNPFPSSIPPNETMPYGNDFGPTLGNAGFLINPFAPNEIAPHVNEFGPSTSSASNTRHNIKGKSKDLASSASQPPLLQQLCDPLHLSDDESDGGRTSATKPRRGKNRAAKGARARRSTEQPLQETMSFATSAPWQQTLLDTTADAQPQVTWLAGGASATKFKGNRKGGISRSVSRSRGTASNSPFNDSNPSDPLFQGITSVPPPSNGDVDGSNIFNWSYPDFQDYQDPKSALPQSNVLGVGGTSATKSKKDKSRTTSRPAFRSRGHANYSPFNDSDSPELLFQGITYVPPPSSGTGPGVPRIKQTLDEMIASNFSIQALRDALPQSNVLGGNSSAYGSRSGTPTNVSAGEVIVSGPSNQSLIFPETFSDTASIAALTVASHHTFAGHTVNGKKSMLAEQVRDQANNRPQPGPNVPYSGKFSDYEKIASGVPGPYFHYPVVQDSSELYKKGPPGQLRTISSKNDPSQFVFALHPPTGAVTGKGHTAMVEGHYHAAVHSWER